MAQNDGKVSGGNDQPEEKYLQHKEARRSSLSKADRLKKLKETQSSAESEESESAESTQQSPTTTRTLPKIQRVPFILRDRENVKKFYEPRAVAIGPFHHGKSEYEQAEKFKYKLAEDFIKESGKTSEVLCFEIEKHIRELKACYEDEALKSYDNEHLASLLFVDGCFILQFILKHNKLGELFKMKRDLVTFEDQDLFLLENQVPYKVLELLMSSSKEHVKLKESIKRFVQNQNQINEQPEDHESIDQPPTHLLELLRTTMLGRQAAQKDRVSIDIAGCQPPNHHHGLKTGVPETTFRNVQELKAAGIYFSPSNGSSTLRDIYFNTFLFFAGKLKLPPIKVDDSMGPKFMNLIAFEMCPDFENDFGITSYIAFLDSLIDHPDDVRHLRKKRILHNLLGCDEEVAKLFNEIGTDLVPNDETYRDVKLKIETHYKTKWKSWIAIFIHERFGSPWTVLAFLGAILALLLSGIQTWYTLHPLP